ncbi:MAG: NAD(P)-dependent oxidoreductase [Candidatus Falkowbacteria bacterium]|nr:NAD(P)-dependent oxidoreductase [Candidatus Falkowbacteria bacterium]
MPILILGGRGNLGSQLTKLFSVDYETVSLDREDFDATNFVILAAKIRGLKPELIINTVAYNAVDHCEDKDGYASAFKLNVNLPAALADLSLEIGAILIHYSSDYVFSGTDQKQSFSEDETPNPANKYGESKFQGEREITRRGGLGLGYYLIRTSKLFGPAGEGPSAKPSFFDIMLDLAQTKQELTVVNEELSCFTYTLDLAAATKRLWELEVPFGIYHLVNGGPVTWYEAAMELFRQKKIKVALRAVRSENLFRAARRPKFSILQNTKVHKLRNWKEALREYLETGKN